MTITHLTLTGFAALAFCLTAYAAPVTNWAKAQGAGPLTNEATASPTLGDGSATSATQMAIFASIPNATPLASLGDKVTFSGSVTLTGITSAANQFRWGLYSTNGSANELGWLGYMGNAGAGGNGGAFHERANPNTAAYFATANGAATTLATAAAPGIAFADGTYQFSLSLERVDTGLLINSSLIRISDSRQFALISITDPSPQTDDFNRVGFLIGSGLNANQVQCSNIDVTYFRVPPEINGTRVFGVDFNRNDALGSPSQAGFRTIAGSAASQAANASTYTKTIGNHQVTISQPNGINFEFRGANTDANRTIPGGDLSIAFLISDFIATRQGAINIAITHLPPGDYHFRSRHLDTHIRTNLGFAQGATPTTRNTIEARIGGAFKGSVQPTALGIDGLNTTFINNSQIPTLSFSFSHDGTSPLTVELRSLQPNGSENFLLLNGFEILKANP